MDGVNHERMWSAMKNISGKHPQPTQYGWKVKAWSAAVSCSPSYTHAMIKEKRIKSVTLGHARIITTRPDDFLADLAKEGLDQ